MKHTNMIAVLGALVLQACTAPLSEKSPSEIWSGRVASLEQRRNAVIALLDTSVQMTDAEKMLGVPTERVRCNNLQGPDEPVPYFLAYKFRDGWVLVDFIQRDHSSLDIRYTGARSVAGEHYLTPVHAVPMTKEQWRQKTESNTPLNGTARKLAVR